MRFSWASLCWISFAVSTSRALMRWRFGEKLGQDALVVWVEVLDDHVGEAGIGRERSQ